MSIHTVKNTRDAYLQSQSPRLLPTTLPNNTTIVGLKALGSTTSSSYFKIDSSGNLTSDSSITLRADLRAITGTPVFTVVSGVATLTAGGDANSRTLTYSNMLTDTVTVEISVEDTSTFKTNPADPNDVYTTRVNISKVFDGTDGLDGADGKDGAEGFNARGVSLIASDQTVEYNASGQTPTPSAVTLTATSVNTSGTVYYQFFVNDVQVQSSTSNTYSYSTPGSFDSMPAKIEVQIREGSETSAILARDQTTVFGLKEGSDGITVLLSNEAHSLPASSSGSVTSFSNSGTEIEVWQGVEQLAYGTSGDGTYSVSAAGSSVTVGSASTSGKKRVYGNISAMSSDLGKITYTITIRGFDGVTRTITKVQSFSKSRAGVNGKDGSNGATGSTGPRTATGYLYYQYSSSSAPAKPSASSFNFSSGTFGSLTSNWSSTPPTFQAGNSNKYWYVFFTVREYSYGGSQAVTISSPSQGMGFSGLVTFSGTSLTNGSSSFNYTQIDGGWIKTGKIDANRLNVNKLSALSADLGTVTAGTIRAGDASVSTYLGSSAEGMGGATGASVTRGVYVIRTGSSSGTLIHSNDSSSSNGYYANYFRTINGDLAKFHTSGGGSYGVTVEGVGSYVLLNVDGTPSLAGVRTTTRNDAVALTAKNVLPGGDVRSDISLATPTHAAYLNTGTVGPFTASHDGLILKTKNAEVGDIIVDLAVAAKNGISDCVCFNQVSLSAKEKSCVGVLSNRMSLEGKAIAANPGIPVITIDKDGREVESIGHSPLAWALRDTHDLITLNAVGEGQINVCGQNGNIEIGDLIVTSDMPGKGMKQDDDIVRNYTVAKSREAVTFDSPDQVKQIACIYLCG